MKPFMHLDVPPKVVDSCFYEPFQATFVSAVLLSARELPRGRKEQKDEMNLTSVKIVLYLLLLNHRERVFASLPRKILRS